MLNKKLVNEIRKIWKIIDFKYYWGCNIDMRYKLIDIIKNLKNKKILDIGGAPGVIDAFIEKNNTVICIDIDRQRLTESKKITNNTILVIADWNNLPFKNELFDVIILAEVLQLFNRNKVKTIIDSLVTLLSPKGMIILTTINRNHLRYKKDTKKYSYNELTTLLEKFNYNIYGWNPFPPFPLFFPNFIVHKIPFIWKILGFFFERKIKTDKCEFLYIEIYKH